MLAHVLLTLMILALGFWAWLRTRRLQKELQALRDALNQNGREQKILSAYSNIEDMLDSFELFVREAREEQALERREIQEYSRQAMAIYMRLLESESRPPTIEAGNPPEPQAKAAGSVGSGVGLAKGAAAGSAVGSMNGLAPGSAVGSVAGSTADQGHPTGSSAGAQRVAAASTQKRSATVPAPDGPLTAQNRDSLRQLTTKTQKIRYLLSLGLSTAETARELDVGIGEVRLAAKTIDG